MILCAAGDTHGGLQQLYDDVLSFEAALHVGDFGVWPDPDRVDRATRQHDGAGDFPTWHVAGRAVPRKTMFIKGNHEDFVWPDAQEDRELLPGLFYLSNGSTFDLGGVTVGAWAVATVRRTTSARRGVPRATPSATTPGKTSTA